MDTVYIETSIVSHATAWPSPNPAIAALQEQAKRWMDEQRPLYDVVLDELGLSGMLICTPIEFLEGDDDDT
jgi:hypothetical protein